MEIYQIPRGPTQIDLSADRIAVNTVREFLTLFFIIYIIILILFLLFFLLSKNNRAKRFEMYYSVDLRLSQLERGRSCFFLLSAPPRPSFRFPSVESF